MVKYKLTIAYDGTHYVGWQIQPNGVSIQEMIQNAIKQILSVEHPIKGAGRTDAGVHAMCQVAHFETEKELDIFRFAHSLNGLLPKDIRILKMEKVADEFHARHSATKKIYHYHLHLDPIHNPFKRLTSLHVNMEIDLEEMKKCAQVLIGTHDFSSFANEAHAGAASKNPIRTIDRISFVPEPGGVRIEFEGKSFLYKMVRNLVGTLLDVGKGRRTVAEVKEILESKDRTKAGKAAPAHGLTLFLVNYNNSSNDG